ncbi:MAG: C39 family peptidase [Bacilli bacterium]|nr:C39 family peptidase [Bacilli bacterium]
MWAAIKKFASGMISQKAVQGVKENGILGSITPTKVMIIAVPLAAVVLLFVAPIIVLDKAFGNIYVIQSVDPDSSIGSKSRNCVYMGSVCGKKTGTTKVLFVGNSRTIHKGTSDTQDQYKDIPAKFKALAASYGYDVSFKEIWGSGVSLKWHADNSLNEIGSDSYDCVVMQEHYPELMDKNKYNDFLYGAQKIVDIVKQKNPDVKTYIRQDWLTRDKRNNRKELDTAYEQASKVAKETSSSLVYTGKAYDELFKISPDMSLFDDNVHQNNKGSYLNALSIFNSLYGEKVMGAKYTSGFDDSTVKLLQQAADESSNNSTVCSSIGGTIKSIDIEDYSNHPKKIEGKCGYNHGSGCVAVATVTYTDGRQVVYHMQQQSGSGLDSGACRAHAFTCAMNAINNTSYATQDLEDYIEDNFCPGSMGCGEGNPAFRGKKMFESAIEHFGVNATYIGAEISIHEEIMKVKENLDNGKPAIVFASGNLSHLRLSGFNNHHALLLLGYGPNGNVMFIDSSGRFSGQLDKWPLLGSQDDGSSIEGVLDDAVRKHWMGAVIYN